MAKYRNKHTREEVGAFQWFKGMSLEDTPDWFTHWVDATVKHRNELVTFVASSYGREDVTVCNRDYIIMEQGAVDTCGEVYALTPETFSRIYEKV